MRMFVVLLLSLLMLHCGQAGDGGHVVVGDGAATLAIYRSQSSAVHPMLEAHRVIVRISGDSFDTLEFAFAADVTELLMEGIPSGRDRYVTVAVENIREQVVRMGEQSDVDIASDGVTDVTMTLDAVPIFTNVVDGSIVANTRFRPEVITAPGHTIHVRYQRDGGFDEPLIDAALGTDAIVTDPDVGVAAIATPPLAPGQYHLVVRDAETARTSQAELTIVDGTQRRSAPFVWAMVTHTGR
jgi:hypothetical protein